MGESAVTPLYVKELPPLNDDELSSYLKARGTGISLETLNWPGFSYKPETHIYSGWRGNELYLTIMVKETGFRALMIKENSMVCDDSCVEFFFSGPEEDEYLNLEINAIGTIHLKRGTDRDNRYPLAPKLMEKIQITSSLKRKPWPLTDDEVSWEINTSFPLFELLYGGGGTNLDKKHIRGNFYKCGDELPRPHYVTWAPVKTDNPDFHRPEYFRDIYFRR